MPEPIIGTGNTEIQSDETETPEVQKTLTPEKAAGITGQSDEANNETPHIPDVPEVPEKYEWALPEGYTMSDDVSEIASGFAKELGMTQDKANKMIDTYIKVSKAQEDLAAKNWEAQVTQWSDEAKKHPVLGGANYEQNLKLAEKGLNAVMSPEAVKLLTDYGMLNNPEIIAGFLKAGKAISEDSLVGGTSKKDNERGVLDFSYLNK